MSSNSFCTRLSEYFYGSEKLTKVSSYDEPYNDIDRSNEDKNNSLIGYATDIEGNYNYWIKYVKISKVFTLKNKNNIILNPNSYFVYGGDVCDRGDGDIRVLKDLMKLKTENPNNVFFILGNRDCNKLRLKFELDYSIVKLTYPSFYWIRTNEFSVSKTNEMDEVMISRDKRLQWVSVTFNTF